MRRWSPSVLIALIAAAAGYWFVARRSAPGSKSTDPNPASRIASAPLAAYAGRLPHLRRQIPAIISAAEAAAQRALQSDAYIHYQYPKQGAFGEEFIARSGGLGNWVVASDPKHTTRNDIVLCTARAWEKDAAELQAQLAEFRKQGWLIILFASSQGMPKDLPCDHFIDTGAATGSAAEGPTNILANETAGWMWTCEFVAALTRHGKHPGVFMSAFYPGEEKHNLPLAQKATLFDCPTPVAAGRLAGIYLDRVERLMTELANDTTRAQIERAAEVVAARLATGGRVGIASCDHTLPYELFHDVKTPFIPFYIEDRGKKAWKDALRPGEMVVWFGYIGMSTKYEPYGDFMRDHELDVVSCFVPDPEPKNNLLPPPPLAAVPGATAAAAVKPGKLLAHIDQHWKIGDAEVPIPFPPGRMAPVSGIDQVLLFRMLDEAVAARLAGSGKTAPGQAGSLAKQPLRFVQSLHLLCCQSDLHRQQI